MTEKKVITRFAPSPTGYLHLGNAKTAICAWLYARANGGEFKVRIEDTDRERYYPDALKVVYRDLKWLIGGLDEATLDMLPEDFAGARNNDEPIWDELEESQFSLADRHREVAMKLIEDGKAYYCHLTREKLDVMRSEARKNGGIIHSPYRGLTADEAREKAIADGDDEKPVVRLMVPHEGELTIVDSVQGEVTVKNSQIDDLVILRGDMTPTYHLSVIVDDYDMGVSHVIRGADHTNNAFRQAHIILACGWELPVYAHLPLLMNMKGAKLSKRDADVAIWDYKNDGILPEAMFNYLLRCGWSHGEDEIVTRENAIKWFDLDAIGRANPKFDEGQITHLNVHYLKECAVDRAVKLSVQFVEKLIGRELSEADISVLTEAMPELKNRVKSLAELAEIAKFLFVDGGEAELYAGMNDKAKNGIAKPLKVVVEGSDEAIEMSSKDALEKCIAYLEGASWNDNISIDEIGGSFNQMLCDFSNLEGFKLGKFLMIIRVGLCFSTITPPFEVMGLMSKDKIIARLKVFLKECF